MRFFSVRREIRRKNDDVRQKNCESFRDAEISGEQRLIWGQKFSEYNDWLECELESFCEDEGVSPEKVFSSLKNELKDKYA